MSNTGRAGLVMLGAALLCGAHSGIDPLAWVAPIPILVGLRGASARRAFYLGLACGAGEALIVAGIAYAGPPIFIALLLSYALARAIFAVGLTQLAPRGIGGVGSAAGLWTVIEWAHAQLSFSAPTIWGNTQAAGPVLPLARLGGVYLLSFVLVAGAASLVLAWEAWRGGAFRRGGAILAGGGATALGLGLLAWVSAVPPAGSMSVAAVQGGIPTWLYRRAEAEPAAADLPELIYTTLTRSAPPAELTVWPETAVWRVWGEDRGFMARLRALAVRRGALLVGVPRRDGSLMNSAVLVTAASEVVVDKQRLALLAEHRFTPGGQAPILPLPQARVGVVFCLETVVPQYARARVRDGAELLVVLAEGSRFGVTAVGALHARYSIVRAVETGRSIVHVGQHGYTALIDPQGGVRGGLPPYRAGVVHGKVALAPGLTPYVRYGDWIVALGAMLLVAGAVIRKRQSGVDAPALGLPAAPR